LYFYTNLYLIQKGGLEVYFLLLRRLLNIMQEGMLTSLNFDKYFSFAAHAHWLTLQIMSRIEYLIRVDKIIILVYNFNLTKYFICGTDNSAIASYCTQS